MRDRQSKIVNLCYIKLDDREEVMTQYDKKLQAPVPLAKRRPNVEIEIVELDDVEEKKGRDEGDGLESDRVLHSPTFLPAKGLRSRRPVRRLTFWFREFEVIWREVIGDCLLLEGEDNSRVSSSHTSNCNRALLIVLIISYYLLGCCATLEYAMGDGYTKTAIILNSLDPVTRNTVMAKYQIEYGNIDNGDFKNLPSILFQLLRMLIALREKVGW
ncbi:hypothetical protein FOZ60_011728 [Perkinsus olseni]|uniref:Uncharacterized protein n=1 Tax=Perkinsus olseni TaxID=32597 RepID=A0A7J6NCP3_PEROL|nr:hypothetical protein FOZ60_011728 [Perkinsus olseni]